MVGTSSGGYHEGMPEVGLNRVTGVSLWSELGDWLSGLEGGLMR